MKRAILSIIVISMLLGSGLAIFMSTSVDQSAAQLPPYGGSEYELDPVPFYWEAPLNKVPTPGFGSGQWWQLSLPFTFELYDWSSNTVWVSGNGFVDFKDGPGGMRHWSYQPFGSCPIIPFTQTWGGTGEYQVAVLWGDYWIVTNLNGIYYDTYPDHVTITWMTSWLFMGGTYLKFQVMLYNNGMIQMNYLSTQGGGWSPAVVGINRGDGQWGLNYWCGSSVTGLSGTSLCTPVGIPADVRVEPQALNLDSKGNFVQVKVEGFPDNPEYSPLDVDGSTIVVAGISADPKFGTWNEDKYIGKVDRLAVEDAIGAPGDEVELDVTGKLNDGTAFEGIASIKAIRN